MVSDELRSYVDAERHSGKVEGDIRDQLSQAGWPDADINAVLSGFHVSQPVAHISASRHLQPFVGTLSILCLVLGVSGTTFYFFTRSEHAISAPVPHESAVLLAVEEPDFSNLNEVVVPNERGIVKQKSLLIETHGDFIEADLRNMKITLYREGIAEATYPILTKGKEQSWWETPTGEYKVLSKNIRAYSSIGNVWMPFSIQFYGNYFIHGWPYDNAGNPVPSTFSGGCIRLNTLDAQQVFAFATPSMPILVIEEESQDTPRIIPFGTEPIAPPVVQAKAYAIVDLTSGETIAEKASKERLPVASLTKLMTAVVAHEVIYLGRSITATSDLLASVSHIFSPRPGGKYLGMDLLYPLLMQSSNDSARVIAGFIGERAFVRNMNLKAESLHMLDTGFVDPAGIGAENTSTALDLAKLLEYIYYKRPFIFDITRGVAFENVGLIKLGDTINIPDLKNTNEFVGDPDLVGVKNGQTTAARQTMATVWNIHTAEGDVPVAIVVLGAENRKKDTETLISWVKRTYATR